MTTGTGCGRNHLNHQRGYLLEIPLLMVIAALSAMLLWAMLPSWARVALLIAVAVVWIFGLYYMLLAPGWQPLGQARPNRPLRLASFLILTTLIVLAVALAAIG